MFARLLSVGISLLTFALASAGDLPVTYSVEEKPLKTLGLAGTPLTFTLYSDGACSQQIHQAVVPIDEVELISRLKRLTPKGGLKGPTTNDLRTTLPGVTAGGNLYLTVTGTGVVPSAATCQAQAAAVQLPPGLTITVRDSTGAVFGIPTDPFGGSGIQVVVAGIAGAIGAYPSGFDEGGGVPLYYASPDCSGTGQMAAASNQLVPILRYRASTSTLYRPPSSGTTQTLASRLTLSSAYAVPSYCTGSSGGTHVPPDGCCQSGPFGGEFGPGFTRDMSAYVPPFHVQ